MKKRDMLVAVGKTIVLTLAALLFDCTGRVRRGCV